jgi:hypothetical protein
VNARRKQGRGVAATPSPSEDDVVASSPVSALTRTESSARQQPRKQARSKRGKA